MINIVNLFVIPVSTNNLRFKKNVTLRAGFMSKVN